MEKEEIKRVYGEKIFKRGKEYFKENRVSKVVKFKKSLSGEVVGTDRYRTEVNLEDFSCRCSCPYRINCKHGVAVLLEYFNGEYINGDEVMKNIESANRDELLEIIEQLISINPENLLYLRGVEEKVEGKEPSEKLVKAVEKQIKAMLKEIKHEYADEGFVLDFSRFIRANEDTLTKEQVFYILRFLVENCEEYGYFYDDYSDSYFGDAIFESLCDTFVRKELEGSDFEKLKELMGKDGYSMLDPFFDRIIEEKNAVRLVEFEDYAKQFLNERDYVEFLINSGKKEKAREIIEEKASLGESSRFNLYLRIDRDKAIEFARKKQFYISLIEHYHKIGEHEEAVDIFEEAVSEKSKQKKISGVVYFSSFYAGIFDSIRKYKGLEESRRKRLLRELFVICYSAKNYEISVDAGIELGDKELLSKLITKDFGAESKIKLLDYLKEDYRGEVEKELKEFAGALIEKKDNYAYEKAVECVFVLREMIGKEKWEEYVKGLYEVHSRKRNLWEEFRGRGITLKRKKDMIELFSRK
jgi:hypothetical protein